MALPKSIKINITVTTAGKPATLVITAEWPCLEMSWFKKDKLEFWLVYSETKEFAVLDEYEFKNSKFYKNFLFFNSDENLLKLFEEDKKKKNA